MLKKRKKTEESGALLETCISATGERRRLAAARRSLSGQRELKFDKYLLRIVIFASL